MRADIARFMLVGPGSGSGKTTLACALLLALKQQGHDPAAFKCGPDYIDPLFHAAVLGLDSTNLDLVLCGEEAVKYLLAKNAQGHGLALIEGVMGLYDGQGTGSHGSSNHVAMATGTPELLVIVPQGQSLTLAAQISGYLRFAPNNIRGVILNQCSPHLYPFYRGMLEEHLGIKVYGFLPPLPQAAFASRHLGLVTPEQLPALQDKLQILAQACLEGLDLEGILQLAHGAEPLVFSDLRQQPRADLNIAVAQDHAFCFYYRDNFELLRELGANLTFFSPLTDTSLPENVSGLILGGGYPEEYAAKLSANTSLREHLRRAVESGLPVLAECGGFLYLCSSLQDRQGIEHGMTGLIDNQAFMTECLGSFGYVTLRAQQDTFLCPQGTTYTAHEFHYSNTQDNGQAFTAYKSTGKSWPCIHASDMGHTRRIFAGYPHFHFRGNPHLATAFVDACARYAEQG